MSAEDVDPVLTERVVAYLLEESEKVTEFTCKILLPIAHVYLFITVQQELNQKCSYSSFALLIELKGVPTEFYLWLRGIWTFPEFTFARPTYTLLKGETSKVCEFTHPYMTFLVPGSNPACGFSMKEQVRLCAVWPMENWLCSSMNHIQGGKTV